MRKIVVALLLTISLNAKIPDDKILHMGAGFLIYVGCLVATDFMHRDKDNALYCLAPVATAAVGKEWYDHQHPENHSVEFMDAVATMAIPLAGSMVLYKW